MARALVWLRGQPLDFKIKKHIFLSSHVYVVEEMNVTCVLKRKFKMRWFKNQTGGASLVAKQSRICLPGPETWVQAPIWREPTCLRGAKGRAPQLLGLCSRAWRPHYGACMSNCGNPRALEPVLLDNRSHRSEKPMRCDLVAPARRN